MSEKMSSQKWVEMVYEKLVEASNLLDATLRTNGIDELCCEVVAAIADGSIKGWTTAQKVCGLIAKARKA